MAQIFLVSGLRDSRPDVVSARSTALVAVGALDAALGGLGGRSSQLGSTVALITELESSVVETGALASVDTLVRGVGGVLVGEVGEVSLHAIVAVHVASVRVPSLARPGGSRDELVSWVVASRRGRGAESEETDGADG